MGTGIILCLYLLRILGDGNKDSNCDLDMKYKNSLPKWRCGSVSDRGLGKRKSRMIQFLFEQLGI